MKAAGYSDGDIRKKPHIGVPNSYMAGSPGTAHLRQITEAVKEGIWAAGGVPVEFGIPATCGNIANGAEELKYEQVGRDIVAMSIEFVTRVHNFDGLVMTASCDNIIAGCYLAAMRLDIPTMVVTGGSMQPGQYCGKTVVEADLDAARFSGASEEELMEMEDNVCLLGLAVMDRIPCRCWGVHHSRTLRCNRSLSRMVSHRVLTRRKKGARKRKAVDVRLRSRSLSRNHRRGRITGFQTISRSDWPDCDNRPSCAGHHRRYEDERIFQNTSGTA